VTTLGAVEVVSAPPQHPALQKTLANLVSVIGGEGILRVANFIVAVAIARLYGSAVFGLYATVLAYVTVVAMLADNGLQVAAIKQLSGSLEEIDRIVSLLYVAKTALFVPALTVLFAFVYGTHSSGLVWLIGGLVTVRTVLQSYCQLQIAILKAINRMTTIGVVQTAHAIILVIGCAVVYQRHLHVGGLMGVLVLGQFTEMTLTAMYLLRVGVRARPVRLWECWDLVRNAAPMGISFSLMNFLLRLDVIVLATFMSSSDVGNFAAAQSALVIVYVVSWLFGSVLLPDLTRLSSHRELMDKHVKHWIRLILAITVPITLIGIVVGPVGLRAVFGQAFDAARKPLALMLISIPFIFLNSLFLNRGFALNHRRVYVDTYAISAAGGLVLSVVMVKLFGVVGISAAVVTREIATFALLLLSSRSTLPSPS
jgi:O-antigen/teichoic acid export membrane protein